MRALAVLAMVVLGPVLAGCGLGPRTGTPDFATIYGRSLVHEAARDGAMPLVVHGRPSPRLGTAEAARLIAESVRLPGWLPPTRLRPASGETPYRVVLIFNPVSIASAANHRCGPLRDIATGDGADGMVVVAAFCSGARAASENRGWVPPSPGADDAALLPLVSQLVTSLFPPENPLLRDDRDNRRGGLLFGD